MTAAHTAGSSAARLIATISEARTTCQGQPARAEHREPRSGALDRPPQRSYPSHQHPTARPAQCGLIAGPICGVSSDTPQSGGGGERADAVQCVDVVAVPGPAGGEVQCPAAGVKGQAAGDRDQPATQGARRADGRGGQTEQLGPSEHVVRERAETVQAPLA